MISVVIHDLLSGRAKIPFSEQELPDESGFPMLELVTDEAILVILDDGSSLSFKEHTPLNKLSTTAELHNDMIVINDVSELKTLDPETTIRTTSKRLAAGGMFEGFEEWWFITRKVGDKATSLLRFLVLVDLGGDRTLSLKPGTRWEDCIRFLERAMDDEPRPVYVRPSFETVTCDRKAFVHEVRHLREGAIPDDLLEIARGIFLDGEE